MVFAFVGEVQGWLFSLVLVFSFLWISLEVDLFDFFHFLLGAWVFLLLTGEGDSMIRES